MAARKTYIATIGAELVHRLLNRRRPTTSLCPPEIVRPRSGYALAQG